MSTTEPRYIRTDPASDLLNSLEHCMLTFTLAHGDERNWKWCIAASHSAAQIAMIMTLDGAGQYEHWESKSREELLTYLNESRDNPNKKYPKHLHLANFMDLYEACKKHLPDGLRTSELYRDVKRLNTLRNHWTHFKVDASSIGVGLARRATLAGIRLVKELPIPTPEYQYNRTDAARYEVAVSSLLRLLSVAEMDTIPPPEIEATIIEALLKLDSDSQNKRDSNIGK